MSQGIDGWQNRGLKTPSERPRPYCEFESTPKIRPYATSADVAMTSLSVPEAGQRIAPVFSSAVLYTAGHNRAPDAPA